MREHSLCYNCLLAGHRVLYCRSKLTCRKCNQKHNTLLHEHWAETGVSRSQEEEDNQEKGDQLQLCTASNTAKSIPRAILKVVPVKAWVKDPANFTQTYAFIDEGSTVNMWSADLVRRLGVSVCATKVELVTSNSTSLMTKKADWFGICGLGESSSFQVKDAFVVDQVVDVSSSILTQELVQYFAHLRELVFP